MTICTRDETEGPKNKTEVRIVSNNFIAVESLNMNNISAVYRNRNIFISLYHGTVPVLDLTGRKKSHILRIRQTRDKH